MGLTVMGPTVIGLDIRRMAHADGLSFAAVGGNPIIVCKEQWSCRGSICAIQLEKLMHNLARCVQALLCIL